MTSPLVTPDLANAPISQIIGEGSVGDTLMQHVTSVSNAAKGLAGMAEADATAALAQVQDSITTLLANGITVANVTPTAMGNALASLGHEVSGVSAFRVAGAIMVSTGGGVAAGAAVGGPIGAAVGGAVGLAEGVLAALVAGGKSTLAATMQANPAEPWDVVILQRLQGWATGYVSTYGPNHYIGSSLYEWVATKFPSGSAPSICTELVWGENPNGCSQANGSFASVPSGAAGTVPVSVQNEMPNDTMAEATLAIGRASTLAPAHWAVGPADGTGMHPVNPMTPIYLGNDGVSAILTLDYRGLYALGTVFSMIAAGASDQAIASELILQMHIVETMSNPNGASYQVINGVPTPPGAMPIGSAATSVLPLAQAFLARIAPAGSASTANVHLTQASPAVVAGNAVSQATTPGAPLSARALSWVDYYAGTGPLPSGVT